MYTHDRKLCITQGNSFTLLVSLTQQIATPTGEDMASDVAGTASEVTIYASNGRRIEVEHDTDPSADVPHWQVADTDTGKAIAVTVPAAAQHIDRYGLEIKGATADGTPWRYKAKLGEAFTIVDATSDQHIPDSQVRIYALSASVGIGAVASGAGPGTASEQWVTDNFQPKGNYISADDMLAVKLREMMAIEVKTPHDGHAASVPIAWTYDSRYCLFFADYEGMSYRPLVFTVKRVGAAWQDVEDAVTAAGYEIVRHEIVLLRKQKRNKRHIIEVDKGYEYTRKLKRGYIPYLPAPDQGESPFEGKDFSQNNSIAMLFTDFLKYDNFHDWKEYNTSNSASFITMKSHDITVNHVSYQFVSISFHKNNDNNPYKADFLRFGNYGRDGNSIYGLFKGQIHIDCAIAEMVEVMGHKRFYGNVVYGRLNIAISSTDEYDSFDNRGKTLNMSFIPHRYVENDISPVP